MHRPIGDKLQLERHTIPTIPLCATSRFHDFSEVSKSKIQGQFEVCVCVHVQSVHMYVLTHALLQVWTIGASASPRSPSATP
jgi:hypothetical protein